MNILAVDTAGKTAGVALLQDDRLLYEVYLDAGMTHSETLMPMIDTCLKMCGMTCADIDQVWRERWPRQLYSMTLPRVRQARRSSRKPFAARYAVKGTVTGDAFPEMEASADIFFIKRRNDL